ncbi:MAG: helix-turn-helix domain-containing protein [Planctomycetota bacterium]|jgi:excisionase family DNA binding protein
MVKDENIYEFLSGEQVSTKRFCKQDREWLRQMKEDASDNADYFILLRSVRGLGAYPFKGSEKITAEIAQSALFRIADDIVRRVGVRQGAVLASGDWLDVTEENPVVSGPEAADIIGITRSAVHKALSDGRLRGWVVGTMWVLSRADVLNFKRKRESS